MTKWSVKYDQVLLQRILDPSMDDVFDVMDTAYYGPAFYGQLSQLLDFELEVRNQGLCLWGFVEERARLREKRERVKERDREKIPKRE
jgi:hypothetical protein